MDRFAYQYTASDFNADPVQYAYSDQHAHGDEYTYSDEYAYADIYSYGDKYAYTDQYVYADKHTDKYSDADSEGPGTAHIKVLRRQKYQRRERRF